jgi:hypothetical protein
MAKAKKEVQVNEEAQAEENVEVVETQQVASRTKRLNITSVLPSTDNDFTLSVSAEVLGTDAVITFAAQTPEVNEFWAKVMVSGIKERFAVVTAAANGDVSTIIDRLNKEVEALHAGNYATRSRGTSSKSDFINTVLAMAFVKKFGEIKVNEDNFNELMSDADLLQETNAEYEALTKEDKTFKVKEFAKLASGISYFRSAV